METHVLEKILLRIQPTELLYYHKQNNSKFSKNIVGKPRHPIMYWTLK